MKKLHPGTNAALLAVFLAIILSRSGNISRGPIDTTLFVLFVIFFWWLTSDFSRGEAGVESDGRQNADNGIAFRFGKFLNRVFRGGNRSL